MRSHDDAETSLSLGTVKWRSPSHSSRPCRSRTGKSTNAPTATARRPMRMRHAMPGASRSSWRPDPRKSAIGPEHVPPIARRDAQARRGSRPRRQTGSPGQCRQRETAGLVDEAVRGALRQNKHRGLQGEVRLGQRHALRASFADRPAVSRSVQEIDQPDRRSATRCCQSCSKEADLRPRRCSAKSGRSIPPVSQIESIRRAERRSASTRR